MIPFVSFIIFCQMLGAIIGAVATVWGELSYLHHVRGGRIDRAERAHLEAIGHGLRFGMTLLLISSLTLVFVAYFSQAFTQPALTAGYWVLIAFALLIVYVSWALSRQRISFALGSALAFTAWWLLAYLTLGLVPATSFGATVAFFVIATAIFYAVLQYTRMLARPKQ
jgi:hypothetical protein